MPFGTQVGQKSFIPRTLTTDETEGVWGKIRNMIGFLGDKSMFIYPSVSTSK